MRNKITFVIILVFTTLFVMCRKVHAADFIYEDDVYSMLEEICAPLDISPSFAMGVAYAESRMNAEAVNGNCKGLMQVNASVWGDLIADKASELDMEADLYDPYFNLSVGCGILNYLFENYGDDPYLVLMLYNQGLSGQKRYDSGLYSKYAVNICNYSQDYEERYLGAGYEKKSTR